MLALNRQLLALFWIVFEVIPRGGPRHVDFQVLLLYSRYRS